MTSITVPRNHYLTVLESAAQLYGVVAGDKFVEDGSFTHPGDPFGTAVSEANKHGFETLVTVAFMQGLRGAIEAADGTPPTLTEVLRSLPYAINDTRYPELDVDDLIERLRREVPQTYGDAI